MEIKDSAKTILCYGDSNTWGRIPNGGRYPRSKRWTVLLQALLGNGYEVIPEGLGGRTLVALNPEKPHLTGITHLQSIIKTHDPVDGIVIMLGTNDVKTTYGLTAETISEHLEQTVLFIRDEKLKLDVRPEILIVCPPVIIVPSDGVVEDVWKNGVEIFKTLSGLYKEVAERNGCRFINAGDFIVSSGVDGFHVDEAELPKLAEALKDEILKI